MHNEKLNLKLLIFTEDVEVGNAGLEKLMHNEKLNLKLLIFTEDMEVGNVVLRN